MNVRSMVHLVKKHIVSVRMLTLLLIWVFMMDQYLAPYRDAAMQLEQKDAAAILPHIQNDFYFNKIMLLAVACFFSKVPFMEQSELYAVIRLGKEKWGMRNIICIFLDGIALSITLTLISIIMIAPATNLSNEWGSLFRTFAISGVGGIEFSNQILVRFSPYLLQVHILLIDAFAFSLLGMILYTISLYLPRIYAYSVVVIMIFLPSIAGKVGIQIDNFSPFSWLEIRHWRMGNDNSKPDLIYIYTAYGLLLLLLALVSQHRIRKTDWMIKEGNR